MKEDPKPSRRQFLKIGGAALALIPVVAVSGKAMAATNAAMRASLKYQNKPNGGKHCAICMHFVPGKNPKALGGCNIIPGDTEISPQGYCVAWAAKA
jgi:anaerobic selenocysteine-containing dehydrogenase